MKKCDICGADLAASEVCNCQQLQLAKPQKALVVLEQLPIITARLKEIEASIDEKTGQAKALVIDKASKQAAKELRAALNKDSITYEEIRKQIKAAILKPYDEFNTEYERVVKSKYLAADVELKRKIDDIEAAEIAEKTNEVKAYFAEALAMHPQLDFVTFEGWGPKINLTVTLTALKKAAAEYLSRIAADVALIDTQEHKEEILVEYKQSLDCARSIVMVKARHTAIEQEKSKATQQLPSFQKEQETIAKVEAIAPPEVAAPQKDGTIYTLKIKVRGTKEKLHSLLQLLDAGGYEYE